MSLIIIILIISILTSLYVVFPLVRKYLFTGVVELELPNTDPEYRFLLREKDQLLSEIMDIDLDFGLEKLDEKDYRELRYKYRVKAADVIKKIELYENVNHVNIDKDESMKIDDEIEKIKNKK